MTADTKDPPERFSLSRWSKRKHASARMNAVPEPAPAIPVTPLPVAAAAPVAAVEEPLPPIESLTIDSDFTKFLSPKVDESVKRAALRKLFSDPRFNVMDGLDIYTGDYSQPDPMPEGMLAKLKDVYEKLIEDEKAAAEPAVDAPPPQVTDAEVVALPQGEVKNTPSA